jgi:hypothetical protein
VLRIRGTPIFSSSFTKKKTLPLPQHIRVVLHLPAQNGSTFPSLSVEEKAKQCHFKGALLSSFK